MTEIEVKVRGSHRVTLPPERGTVHATVSLEGAEPEPVFHAVENTLSHARHSIEVLYDTELGPITWFSIDQIVTSTRRPWTKKGEQLPLVHTATARMTAKFREFGQLGKWVSWSAGVEGLTIDYIDWDLTEARKADVEREARQAAVRNARDRAQDYSDALDLGPVTIRGISDSNLGDQGGNYRMTMDAIAGSSSDGEALLVPEHVEINASVLATFVVSRSG